MTKRFVFGLFSFLLLVGLAPFILFKKKPPQPLAILLIETKDPVASRELLKKTLLEKSEKDTVYYFSSEFPLGIEGFIFVQKAATITENLFFIKSHIKDESGVVVFEDTDPAPSKEALSKIKNALAKGSFDVPLLFSDELKGEKEGSFFGSLACHSNLLKKISLENLFEKGDFLEGSFYGALLGFHHPKRFVDPSFGHTEKKIAKIQPPKTAPKTSSNRSDLIAFSYNRPLQLELLLRSIDTYVRGVGQVSIIIRADPPFYAAYKQLEERFSKCHFIYQDQQSGGKDFRALFTKTLSESESDFILFAVDDLVFKDYLILEDAADALAKSGAYCFRCNLGDHTHYCYMRDQEQGVPPHVIFSGIRAFRFCDGTGDWAWPNSLDATLYRRKEVLETIQSLSSFSNPSQLEWKWSEKADLSKVGLFYETSKALNVPLNVVSNDSVAFGNRQMNEYTAEELLSFFEAGLRIQLTPLHQIRNESAHCEIDFQFEQESGA